MADNQTSTPCDIDVVNVVLPSYCVRDPRLWFAQVEAVFECRRITSQQSRYSFILPQLPYEVASEISDLIYQKPLSNQYDAIKEAIINRTATSEEQNLRRLLTGVEIGDRNPSQLLRHMSQLQGKERVNTQILRELWLQSLSQDIRNVLSVLDKDTPLPKLAEIADQVHSSVRTHPPNSLNHIDHSQPQWQSAFESLNQQVETLSQRINSLVLSQPPHTRPRSRSRPNFRSASNHHKSRSPSHSGQPGVCYYHRRFGAAARRCTKPCSFVPSQTPGNAFASQ